MLPSFLSASMIAVPLLVALVTPVHALHEHIVPIGISPGGAPDAPGDAGDATPGATASEERAPWEVSPRKGSRATGGSNLPKTRAPRGVLIETTLAKSTNPDTSTDFFAAQSSYSVLVGEGDVVETFLPSPFFLLASTIGLTALWKVGRRRRTV